MIRKGDILLIRNYLDPVSWIISLVTKSNWTHTAWCISDTQLLELRSNGLAIRPINKYYQRPHYKIKLLRLKRITKEEIHKATEYIWSFGNNRNYFKFFWTLILIGFGYVRKRPIVSCSGCMAYCLSRVGFYFKKGKNPLLITPADIDQSKNTTNITAKELF